MWKDINKVLDVLIKGEFVSTPQIDNFSKFLNEFKPQGLLLDPTNYPMISELTSEDHKAVTTKLAGVCKARFKHLYMRVLV